MARRPPLHTVKTDQLRVGMYVILPTKWTGHPFVRTRFLLKRESEIEQIRKAGITEVQVDSSLSQAAMDFATISHGAEKKCLRLNGIQNRG